MFVGTAMKQSPLFAAFICMMFALVITVIVKSKLPADTAAVATIESQTFDKKFRIAIMIPVTHPALEEIAQGFKDTLVGKICCVYDLYNANGDRVLMRHQAEEIATKNYDLIFTIATGPALIMKEVCVQRNIATPMVAGAVDDPVGIKLVESMQSSGNNITAVTSVDKFELQIDTLKFLKPTLKNILLVYCPSSAGIEKNKQEVECLCCIKGIGFKAVAIFNMSDLTQKIPNVIQNYDTVMVLKDNTVVSGIESLVNLCNKSGKTLYASDLNSGSKGAALSFGVFEYQDGVESAYKALEVLKDGKTPTQVPSSATQDFKIRINTKTMQRQDLDISSELLFTIKSGDII